MSDTPDIVQKRIWDPLLRILHWSLVITVLAGYFIGENMSFANISWHFWMGYTTGGLLLARLAWGIFGPKPARFSDMLAGPRKTLAYATGVGKRTPSYWPGHNPMGAWSAVAIWLVLAGMVITGLFSESDDFFETAPMAHYISSEMRLTMNSWHHTLHLFVMPLVLLHLCAIAFYYIWKRENLVRPMITGWKWVRRNPTEPTD